MRQNCIDTIDTTTAPLPSWGQWAKAGMRMVRADALQLVYLLVLWHRRHAHRRSLQNISDEALIDVGLTREQIEHQAARPFWKG